MARLFVLDTTSKSIVANTVLTSSSIDFICTYADNTGAVFTEKGNEGKITSNSNTTIVPPPASGVRRVVKTINLYNSGTATQTIRIYLDSGGTLIFLTTVVLEVNNTWSLDDQTGVNAGGSMVYPGAGIAVSNGTAWITPKNSPTGDVVGTSDSQALTNKTINGASNTISNINLASQVTGILPIAKGGTGAATVAANLVFAGATTGGDNTPSFRSLVAADVPTLNQNTTGTASNVSGTVAVANGGTGQTSYSDGQLLIGNTSTGGLTKAALTAGSNITITNGAGAITIASTASGGGGVPPNHIYGLELRWNPTNGTATNDKRTVRISPGGAYIPAASAVLTVSSSIDVLISTITAKTWYYLYLYNNGGTPAVEASTTVPVFYYGRASQKTGDNSRRFIGAVQADWNATPLLTPFYATCQNDYVIYNHIGFDHRAQWRILAAGSATASTNFNLRSTMASNLNAELVPDVVYKSYIVAFVQSGGGLAGIGPRGLTVTSAPNTPFDMAVYASIPGISGFPFLPPATVPIDPSDGRTSYYVVAVNTSPLYLDATGCEYWR